MKAWVLWSTTMGRADVALIWAVEAEQAGAGMMGQ